MMEVILTTLATGKMNEVVKCTIVNSRIFSEAGAILVMNMYDAEYS